MLFSSLTFLFLFLPSVIICYYISPKKIRNYILLIFSLFFYFYGGPKFLMVMLISIFVNYIFGLLIYKSFKYQNLCKILVACSVILNLAMLVYYKYAGFFIANLNSFLGLNIKINKIIMPIGISFFTFQAMSYVIDVYRKNADVQHNIFNLALYIMLFPQLIAGPIVRYETVAEEITSRKETLDDFVNGIERFILGLGKKILLANTFGYIADIIFTSDPKIISVLVSWIGAISYSVQIYFDFSGYSDMAIGLGQMFGFHFLENFNYPYISKSITEFWRRWHISLSTWFRDYVYIPLKGNRCSVAKHLRNLFIVWFLTGLWHGASWNFIVWGLYFGVILALEKYILSNLLKKLPTFIQHIYALILIIVGWVFFRSVNLSLAIDYLKTMFFLNNTPIIDNQGLFLIKEYKLEFIIMIFASIPLRQLIKPKLRINIILNHTFLTFVFLLSILSLVNSSFNPFIYFRF